MNKLSQLSEVRSELNNFFSKLHEEDRGGTLAAKLAELKSSFVAENNQTILKEIWCLEKIIAIQKTYLLTFYKLKLKQYYEAWCSLENIEIYLSQLFRHLNTEDELFPKVAFIKQHTLQYQSLFPYRRFISPEFTVKFKTCSICNKNISIRHACGHKNGEIYNGEMCYQIWDGIEYLLLAIVKSPVQKFCVIFFDNPETGERVDYYDYSHLEYLMSYLHSPFHFWEIHWTTIRYPHSDYLHIKPNDYCPCESGKKYNYCCLSEPGVLRPWAQIALRVPPLKHMEIVKYPNRTSEKKVKASVQATFDVVFAQVSDYLVETATGDFVQIKL